MVIMELLYILATCWSKLLVRLPGSLNVYKLQCYYFFFSFCRVVTMRKAKSIKVSQAHIMAGELRYRADECALHAFLSIYLCQCAVFACEHPPVILWAAPRGSRPKRAFQKCKKSNPTSRSSNHTVWLSRFSSQLLAFWLGNGVFMRGSLCLTVKPS